jgi:hypothetical protein
VFSRARSLVVAVLASIVLAPALTHAEARPRSLARLTYQRGVGAEACMDEAGLRIEVARRSGYDPFTADAPARLTVTVVRQGRQLIGTLQFFDDKGLPGWSRTYPVGADDCETLVSAMGSEISYQFQPSQAVQAPIPPAPGSPAPAVPAPAPQLVFPDSIHPIPEPFRAVELSAGASVSAGAAPGIAFGATLGAAYRFPVFSLAGELRFTAPASAAVPSIPGARISVLAFGGAVLPCVRLAPVYGCAVLSIAEVFGSSSGVDIPGSDSGAYVGAGLRGGVDAPISPRFALRFSLEALGSIRGAHLVLDGSEVWKTSPVTGSIMAAFVTFL